MIIVHSPTGKRHQLDAVPGQNLMLQLRPMKVGVIGLCGGNAVCGTCHVIVRNDQYDLLEPFDDYEEALLEGLSQRQPTSRLACQIVYQPPLEGLELTVALGD
jgi:2Fe-2S ferredoxin